MPITCSGGRAEGIQPGDYHVYHGLGPIGLAGINISRASGAADAIGFEPVEERREIAKNLGSEHVYDPREIDPVDAIYEATDGRGADIHLETAGAVQETYPIIEKALAE